MCSSPPDLAWGWNSHLLDQLHQLDQFTVGVQETDIARSPELIWQDMQQDFVQELHAAQGMCFNLAGIAVLIAERDFAIAICIDAPFGQCPAIQITP